MKEVIRSCKAKDIQYNSQKNKHKRISNDLQNVTQKIKKENSGAPKG